MPGWHRADIIAAVHKKGTSLAALARKNRLGDSTLRAALINPRTPSNKIIADFLGLSLHALWPVWFDAADRLIPQTRKPATARDRASSQKRKGLSTAEARR